MITPGPGVAPEPGLGVVGGVDVDAVVAAVRGCPGVADLCSSRAAPVGSYLPGRHVPGVTVAADALTVQVRAAWAVPFHTIAARIQLAVAALGGGRRVDVVVAETTDPPPSEAPPSVSTNSEGPWTTTTARPGAPSSAPVTPTGEVTRLPS